jgi:hypothetical protein
MKLEFNKRTTISLWQDSARFSRALIDVIGKNTKRHATPTELHDLKEELLRPLLENAAKPELRNRFQLAANEAMAAACTESFPSLLFPCLFEEKVKEVLQWFRRQQRILNVSRVLCGQLELLRSFNNSPLTQPHALNAAVVNRDVMKMNSSNSETVTLLSRFGSFVSSHLSKRSLAMHS